MDEYNDERDGLIKEKNRYGSLFNFLRRKKSYVLSGCSRENQ